MGNFNIMGAYSGIDMSVIDQMIEAEKSKGVQFTNRKEKIEREQGAWKDVGTRLTSLGQKSDALTRSGTFKSRTVSTNATGNPAVSVTAGNSAPVGDYRVHVKQLATSSRVTGNRIDLDTTDEAEKKKNPIDRDLKINGKFKFTTDDLGLGKDNTEISQVFEIDIEQGDSLRKITENINAKTEDSGIRASIVDNRLILTDTKMGDREITIENNDIADKLGFVDRNSVLTGNEVNLELVTDDSVFSFENADGIKFDVKIVAGSADTLADIVSEINLETNTTGIEATIDGNRLVLTDTKFGDRAITVTANTASKALGFFNESNEVVSEKTVSLKTSEAERGQGAIFTIDGLEIERDTNRISDAIEGIAFTLTSKHADGESELISVTNNTQKGVDAVKEFIDQYNSVMNFIQTQTDVGTPSEDNNTTGALVGEGSIMRLQSSLRSMLGGKIGENNKISVASQIGIEVDRYGVATLDEAKLSEALREDPEAVARFFYRPEAAESGGVEAGAKSGGKEEGMSELFKNLIDTYTARSKGIISTKNQSYERMVKQINEQIETFNERIDRKRDRYISQFAALDEAMMRAESQMEYLYSQMNIE